VARGRIGEIDAGALSEGVAREDGNGAPSLHPCIDDPASTSPARPVYAIERPKLTHAAMLAPNDTPDDTAERIPKVSAPVASPRNAAVEEAEAKSPLAEAAIAENTSDQTAARCEDAAQDRVVPATCSRELI
jgi:hypothetical protein